jgi:regulatory protein
MVNGELEENSNSLRDNITVSKKEKGTAGKGIRLCLSDGSSFFLTEELSDCYEPGDPVDPGLFQKYIPYKKYLNLLDRTYKILSFRDHSRYELKNKIQKRSDHPYVVPVIMEIMTDTGLLNDARFAENWIRSRLKRKPLGFTALMSELKKRGVSEEDAGIGFDAVVSDTAGDCCKESKNQLLDEAAERVVEKMLRNNPQADPRKIMRKLKYRGFHYGRIRKSLKKQQFEI